MGYTKEGAARGGHTQSQKIHYCHLCDEYGQGPVYKKHHVDEGKCEGKGHSNWRGRQNAKRLAKLLGNLF